jgi:hypothetical protein
MCLHEVYIETVYTGKHLPDSFPFVNKTERGDDSSPLPFNFALEYAIEKFQENQ